MQGAIKFRKKYKKCFFLYLYIKRNTNPLGEVNFSEKKKKVFWATLVRGLSKMITTRVNQGSRASYVTVQWHPIVGLHSTTHCGWKIIPFYLTGSVVQSQTRKPSITWDRPVTLDWPWHQPCEPWVTRNLTTSGMKNTSLYYWRWTLSMIPKKASDVPQLTGVPAK